MQPEVMTDMIIVMATTTTPPWPVKKLRIELSITARHSATVRQMVRRRNPK